MGTELQVPDALRVYLGRVTGLDHRGGEWKRKMLSDIPPTELKMVLWSGGENPEINEMDKVRPLKSGLHLLVRYL